MTIEAATGVLDGERSTTVYELKASTWARSAKSSTIELFGGTVNSIGFTDMPGRFGMIVMSTRAVSSADGLATATKSRLPGLFAATGRYHTDAGSAVAAATRTLCGESIPPTV